MSFITAVIITPNSLKISANGIPAPLTLLIVAFIAAILPLTVVDIWANLPPDAVALVSLSLNAAVAFVVAFVSVFVSAFLSPPLVDAPLFVPDEYLYERLTSLLRDMKLARVFNTVLLSPRKLFSSLFVASLRASIPLTVTLIVFPLFVFSSLLPPADLGLKLLAVEDEFDKCLSILRSVFRMSCSIVICYNPAFCNSLHHYK